MAMHNLAPILLTALALVALPVTTWAAQPRRTRATIITPAGLRDAQTDRQPARRAAPCRTRAELDAYRADQRQELERTQAMKPTMCDPDDRSVDDGIK